MALYRLELSSPKTATKTAKTWTFDPATENVISIELELKKETHRISVLQAAIEDPLFETFNALPDPAFFDVGCKLSLNVVDGSNQPQVVFDGKVTALHLGYPAPDKISIVAHDKSVELRKQQRYRAFRGKSSVQLAQLIAKEYGFKVETDGSSPKPLDFQFGAELSDWAVIGRALAYDGLEVFTKGTTLQIRQIAKTPYSLTFKRGEYPVVSLEASINHVSSGLDKRGTVPLENGGTVKAATGDLAKEADAAKAEQRTHRRPVGAAEKSDRSHSEDPGNAGWTNQVTQLRRRKDEATLTIAVTPDLTLSHTVKLEGWGAKIDGQWFIHGLKHAIASGEFPTSVLTMKRAPTSGGSTSGLVALQNKETKA